MKRAESNAISLLDPSIGAALTPLFEVIELDDVDEDVDEQHTLDRHIERAIEYLTDTIEKGRLKRYFLDSRSLETEGVDAIRIIIERAQELDARCVPVTGISREEDGVAELAAKSGSGVALRLNREDLSTGRVKRELLPWVKMHSLSASSVDVIMDVGAVGEMVEEGVQSEGERFLAALPMPLEWRTLTLSAVAFSLREIDTDSTVDKDRLDWRVWRDHVHANRESLVRLPTFSDGGIQHPRGVENIPPKFLKNFAPTIRYATNDQWMVSKGVGSQSILRSTQFPSMAQALVANKRFMGARHCKGCADAERAAQGKPNLGSQEVWLRIGAIHHLTLTVEQLRALSWP